MNWKGYRSGHGPFKGMILTFNWSDSDKAQESWGSGKTVTQLQSKSRASWPKINQSVQFSQSKQNTGLKSLTEIT
jgi:hypothetical protein